MDVAWSEARRLAWATGRPLPVLERPLAEAVGSILAGDVLALAPSPAFAMAAMDGWAVAGAGPWRVVGRRLAGSAPRGAASPLVAGTALEVATGSAVPFGATAVLPYEGGVLVGEWVEGPAPPPGQHVRQIGEEFAVGDLLLSAGQRLRPAGAGLMAAAGHDLALARKAPRVSVLVSGDELVTSGLPGYGQVRDAVGPMLPPLLAAYGAECVGVQLVADTCTALCSAVDAVASDVVVVSGASSVGLADHLSEALRLLGADVVLHGVACRPGHPQLLAVLPDGRPVVGLPGNPLAGLAAVVTLLEPLLAKLSGAPLPVVRRLEAQRGWWSGTPAGVTRLVPARETGTSAEPLPYAGSAMLRGAAVADGFLILDDGPDAGYVRLPGAVSAPAQGLVQEIE
jgi:molybdopterin molybdotransferase